MGALYRTYRPKNFGEVIGQDHIKQAIQNALVHDKVGHAYIFAGPRGSGKTTFARLFAKSANCLNRQKDGNPCNRCELCGEIAAGAAVDVIEIDAASNRGIDEIRELRERVNFSPVRTKYKVYIIDEVHMLTREAFNALLKTLEEPPAHVVFILATTELHKVPETIMSRCQRYHFHRASSDQLRELLAKVAKAEKIPLANDAYGVLVARSEGSFRDGLSLLGSLAGQQEKITAAGLHQMFGLPPQQVIDQLLKSLESGETITLKQLLVAALDEGLDLVVLTKVLCDVFKQRILSASESTEIARDAVILEQLLVALSRSRYSSDPAGSIIARLVAIAGTVQPAIPVEQTTKVAETPKTVEGIRVAEPVGEVDPISSPVKPVEGADEFWNALLHEVKQHNHALYMLLKSAVLLELTDAKMHLAVRFRFYSERLFEAKNRQLLEKIAEKISGKNLILECEVRSDLDTTGGNDEDLVNAVVDVFELEEVSNG